MIETLTTNWPVFAAGFAAGVGLTWTVAVILIWHYGVREVFDPEDHGDQGGYPMGPTQ